MDGPHDTGGCHNLQREASLTHRSARTPGPDKVAASLDTEVDALEQTTAATAAGKLRSLDAPSVSTARSRRVGTKDDRIAAGAIDRDALREAVAELPERDRRVLFEYFINGHTLSQIAAHHFVSQMQVSRCITAALRRVGNLLGETGCP